MQKNTIIATVFVLLFLMWELISRLNSHLVFVLPAPSNIFITMWNYSDRFLLHTLVTLKEMAGGFALALSVAFPLAGLMLIWKPLRMVLQPIIIVIQCIPMFALAPIMVIWFSWSYTAIVVPTALMIFFPMTMNIYRGLHSTPTYLLDYFQVNQASTWQTFFKLQLPWALPHICSGFRISAGIAGIGAVTGEWAGGQQGLGILMLESRRGADLEMTFGALVCLTLLSLSLFAIMTLVEEKLLHRDSLAKIKKLISHLRIPSLNPVRALSTAVILLVVASGSLTLYSYAWRAPVKAEESRLVLDWLPNPNHVPIYAGIEKGIFAQHGINIILQKMHDPGDGMTYLTSEQADLAITYMPSTIRAVSKGAKLKSVGILVKEPLNCLLVRSEDNLQSPDDLNGKVFGYCIDGSQTRTLDTLLRNRDITFSAKRNVSFDLVSTLGTNMVDAVYGAFWNIEGEHLRALNVDTTYFKVTDFGMPDYHELIVVAKEGTRQADPDFVYRFQIALQQSIDFTRRFPEEAFACYLVANPDKGSKTQTWEREALRVTMDTFAINQFNDWNTWQNYYEWQVSNGLVDGVVDIASMISY